MIRDESRTTQSDYARFLLPENQHPAASLYPPMGDEDLEILEQDIRANGLWVSLVVLADSGGDEKLLDGRSRARACDRAGLGDDSVRIDRVTQRDIGSPTEFVLSLNSHRRHLTSDQRKGIAAKAALLLEEEARQRQLANLRQNADVERASTSGKRSRDIAASAIGKTGRAIQGSITIAKQRPDLNEEQIAGRMTEAQAKEIVKGGNVLDGNAEDGRHYWLSPPELTAKVAAELGVPAEQLYDPCPYPVPEGYDGLEAEWGRSTYLNPPFGGYDWSGEKIGPTRWARKVIAEVRKGKDVCMVFPVDGWVLMLLEAGAKIVNFGKINWLATEDGQPNPRAASRPLAGFILRGGGEQPEAPRSCEGRTGRKLSPKRRLAKQTASGSESAADEDIARTQGETT